MESQIKPMEVPHRHPSAISPLNLPPAQLKLRLTDRGEEIYDPLRQKWVILTPEEWVRQNFTAYLITSFGYPARLMANEISVSLNGTSKRCDTVIHDRNARPLMIIEYKAPSVQLTQKVFDQIARYNIVLNVKYLMVSNGLRHYCCMTDSASGKYKFLREIPAYETLD